MPQVIQNGNKTKKISYLCTYCLLCLPGVRMMMIFFYFGSTTLTYKFFQYIIDSELFTTFQNLPRKFSEIIFITFVRWEKLIKMVVVAIMSYNLFFFSLLHLAHELVNNYTQVYTINENIEIFDQDRCFG